MTEKEAIIIRSCYANGVEFRESIGIPEEYQKLAVKLDEAIKKQIPMKPNANGHDHIRYALNYNCPNCDKIFSGTGIANYCYHCGQALDWGD